MFEQQRQSTSQPGSFALKSNREQTRQLASDIKEALENPEYDQAIQEAVIKAGVPQRLNTTPDVCAISMQDSSLRGSVSPHSTITFTPADAEAAAAQHVAAAVKSSAGQLQRSTQQEGSTHELKQQVESLLQRTDSILSRSSGHSTARRSLSGAPVQRRRTATVNGGGIKPSRHSTAFLQDGASAGTPDSESPSFWGGAGIGALGGLDGLSPRSEGIGVHGPGRRLSQQGQSEAGEARFGSRASRATTNTEAENRIFESGISADRTTILLTKSASWKVMGRDTGQEPAPYTNFAPLVDALVEVVATETGTSSAVTANTMQAAAPPAATAAAASLPAAESAAGGALPPHSRTDRISSSSGHVPHKVALGYMLQPDYVQTTALNRLKADLGTLSTKHLLNFTPGSSQFDVLLLALTARLSQWPQLERKADETFHQMLDTLLDNVFARVSASRGRVPATDQQRQPRKISADESTGNTVEVARASFASAFGSAATVAGCATGNTAGTTMPATADVSFVRMSSAPTDSSHGGAAARSDKAASTEAGGKAIGSSAATNEPSPEPVKLSDSMVRAAFAKLALGQAMLRQGMQMRASVDGGAVKSPVKQTDVASAASAGAGDATVAGTPDVGISPALSRAASSSISSHSHSLTFDKVAAAGTAATPTQQQQQQQHLQQQLPAAQGAGGGANVLHPAAAAGGVQSGGGKPQLQRRTTVDRLAAAASRLGSGNIPKWQAELQQQQQLQPHMHVDRPSPQNLSSAIGGASGSGTGHSRLKTVSSVQQPDASAQIWQRPGESLCSPTINQQQLLLHAQPVVGSPQSGYGTPTRINQHQQHQQCESAAALQWVSPGPQQQRQLSQRVGLGAWLPNVGSVSPGVAAAQPGSSSLAMARLARLRSHGKALQQQQQKPENAGDVSNGSTAPLHTIQHNMMQQGYQTGSPDQNGIWFPAAHSLSSQFHYDVQQSQASVLSGAQQHWPQQRQGQHATLSMQSNRHQAQDMRVPALQQSHMHGWQPVSVSGGNLRGTPADKQQQHDQLQRQLHRPEGQQQAQQQSWLQQPQLCGADTYFSTGAVNTLWSSAGKPQQTSYRNRSTVANQSHCPAVQQHHQQQPAQLNGTSTAVRVTGAGGLPAPSISVYEDGVEVHSSAPLVISVTSSPTKAGAAAEHGGTQAEHTLEGSTWLSARRLSF